MIRISHLHYSISDRLVIAEEINVSIAAISIRITSTASMRVLLVDFQIFREIMAINIIFITCCLNNTHLISYDRFKVTFIKLISKPISFFFLGFISTNHLIELKYTQLEFSIGNTYILYFDSHLFIFTSKEIVIFLQFFMLELQYWSLLTITVKFIFECVELIY